MAQTSHSPGGVRYPSGDMRTPLLTLAILSAALLGVGCKKGPELAGKWNATAGGQTIEVEFKPDNTFTMGSGPMKAKGDYKLAGEKLTLTTKDVEIPGLPPALVAKAKQMPDFGKPKDTTIKFVNDDEVSISGLAATGAAPAQALTLTRVKS